MQEKSGECSMNGNTVPVTNFFCSPTSRVSSDSSIFPSSGLSQRKPQRGRRVWNVKIQKYKNRYVLPRSSQTKTVILYELFLSAGKIRRIYFIHSERNKLIFTSIPRKRNINRIRDMYCVGEFQETDIQRAI
jgi:hypothetical protein